MNSSLAVAAFGSQQRASLWADNALAGPLKGAKAQGRLYLAVVTGKSACFTWLKGAEQSPA